MRIAGFFRRLHPAPRDRVAPAAPIEMHPTFDAASTSDIDHRPFAAAVKDQGSTGSCEGHSTSGALETSFAGRGTPLGFVPSEDALYKNARALDRLIGLAAGAPLLALEDTGSSTASMFRGIAQWGIKPRQARAKDGRNSDVDSETVNDEPRLDELEAEAHRLVGGEYEIKGTDTADLCAKIRRALNALVSVRADFFVDTACATWAAGDAPLGAPNLNDPSGGWHAVYVVGARTDKNGHTVLIVRNSWGTGYGDGGDFEVGEPWIAAVVEWHAIGVSLKGAA